MKNRLAERSAALAAARRCALAPYVTAGDGGPEVTLAVLRALEASGAACAELGVPFSDPVADGPVLQAAARRALAHGTSLGSVLELVRELRAGGSELPIALFSYANPLLRLGWRAAARRAAEAGADALLVPDLPLEEGGELRAAARDHGLCPIFFAAPTSGEARVRAAAEASRGFLYVIGRVGVTGGETELGEEAARMLARVRRLSAIPIAVGFGLRTAAQVRTVARHAELAVVGSALVQHVHDHGGARADPQAAARAASEFLGELSRGLAPSEGLPR